MIIPRQLSTKIQQLSTKLLAGVSAGQLAVIYAGDTELSTSDGRVMPFPKTY